MIKVFEAIAQDGLIRLPAGIPPAAHCVVTVIDDDLDVLREQSQMMISEAKQQRMSELLGGNREGKLTASQREELDALSQEFDTATLTKSRALAVLAHLNNARPR